MFSQTVLLISKLHFIKMLSAQFPRALVLFLWFPPGDGIHLSVSYSKVSYRHQSKTSLYFYILY